MPSKKQRAKKKKQEKPMKSGAKAALCPHGPPHDPALIEKYHSALKDYEQILARGEESENQLATYGGGEFVDRNPTVCVDEGFVKYIICYCVTCAISVLQIEQSDERNLSGPIVKMALVLKLIYQIIPESKGQDTGPGSENYEKFVRYTKRLDTKIGFVSVLDKHTQCNCLDELVARLKHMDTTAVCHGCMEIFPRHDVKYCVGCNLISYCSTECQSQNWESHKLFCKPQERQEQKLPLCFHGVTRDEASIMQVQEYGAGVLGYLHILNQLGPGEQGGAYFLLKYPALGIDEGFVKYIMGYCTSTVLRDPNNERKSHEKAQHLAVLALNLLYSAIPESKGQDTSPGSDNYSKFAHYAKRLWTVRGFIHVLRRHKNCNCLDALAASAKQMEKTCSCTGCHLELPQNEAFLCNGCRFQWYCSTECQTKDWDRHKRACYGRKKT